MVVHTREHADEVFLGMDAEHAWNPLRRTSPPNAKKSGDFADLSTATSLNRLLQKFLAHVQIETGG